MNFAVVTFPEDNDSLGVIPTNWITSSGCSCLYPTVTSDFTKNKLIYNRHEPKKDWKEFKIRILKKYEKYETAKSHLSDAEMTSNIESECETATTKKRQRKERIVVLPGESSSSDDEMFQNKKFATIPKFPPPPTSSTAPTFNHSPTTNTHYDELTPPTPHFERLTETTMHSDSPIITPELIRPTPNSKFKKGLFSPASSSTSSSTSLPPFQPLLEDVNTVSAGPSSSSSGCSSTANTTDIQQNQKMIWEVLGEFSKKLDSIMGTLARLESRSTDLERMTETVNPEDDWSMADLPLNNTNFLVFEDKLQDPTFRQKIVRVMINLSGNTIKSFAANIMKKLMSDEVAEEYSLTGKVTTGIVKKVFSKTRTFMLVREICFRKFKDGEENKLREGISDWLMQAKFRRMRREKRRAQNIIWERDTPE